MDKEILIRYLTGQLQKIDQDDFNFESWKSATIKVLDNALGSGNEFSAYAASLTYEEKLSYEELYPKKIRDIPASLVKFKSVIREIIDQIAAYDQLKAQVNEKDLSGKIIDILKYHLKGSQIEEIKAATTAEDQKRRKEGLLDILEKMDSQTLHLILRDLLDERAIRKKL